ncbi:MAG: polysaccharide biosynthesis tyrosine autokinase [Pseudomonadota bacterium]|nr:polysaccharide biosynthesis tyrosine autokinase [Pseudomonadota bacterium]
MKEVMPSNWSQSQVEQADDEIDLLQIASMLWSGKWLILLFCVAFGSAAWLYVDRFVTPLYTARAVVSLENREESVVDLQSVTTGVSNSSASIATEIEVLRSRSLAEQLIENMGLDADPRFNPNIDREGPLLADDVAQDIMVDRVLGRISVSNVRSSYAFQLQSITPDPALSAGLVNALADLYTEDQIRWKAEATQRATGWLTERVEQLQIELEAAESAFKTFSAETTLLSAEALEAYNLRIKETRSRILELEAQKSRLEAQLVRSDTDSADSTPQPAGNGTQRTRSEAPADLTTQIAQIDSRIEAFSRSLSDQEAQYEVQSADLVRFQQLQRELEAARAIYTYFLTRLKETSVQQGIQQPDSRVLSYAPVPRFPSSPNKRRTVALGIILGLVAGAGLVLLREMITKNFRTVEDLERVSGRPVFGQIPLIPGKTREETLSNLKTKPTSAQAEALRNLRTSVLMSSIDNPPKVIMFTSALPGEGKSTLAIGLAQNMSNLGKKVLLIEGDARRQVFSAFGLDGDTGGLSDVLVDGRPVEDVIVTVPDQGVDLLSAGKLSTNSSDVFSSDRFREMMKTLRETYDFILIDSPPVLLVSDARLLSQHADATLLVVKWNDTSHQQVREALRQFDTAGQRVTGLALNRIDTRKMKKYGYGKGYGGYGYYGSGYYS